MNSTIDIFSANLKHYMSLYELNNKELSEILGVSESTVGKWLLKKAMPRMGVIEKLSKHFGVQKSDLLEAHGTDDIDLAKIDGIIPLKKLRRIPILGEIACGNPILAEENYIGYFTADDKYLDSDFCLYAKGDSMIGADIEGGDLVFIKQQPDVDDGEIAAVLIDDEATLKRVYKIAGNVQLRADNPHYPPIDLDGTKDVRILGKATHVLKPVD